MACTGVCLPGAKIEWNDKADPTQCVRSINHTNTRMHWQNANILCGELSVCTLGILCTFLNVGDLTVQAPDGEVVLAVMFFPYPTGQL